MSLDNIDDLLGELDEIKEETPIIPPSTKESIEKDPEPITPRIRTVTKIKEMKVPDFNDFLKFCDKYRKDDYEIEQFYKHTIPRRLHKEKYQEDRGGGGWSGAVKATINILRKMKEKGELEYGK